MAERAPTNTAAQPAANPIMDNTTSFTWDDRYLLGHPAMDDTHRAFVEVVDAMLSCADEDFAQTQRAFIVHAEKHLADEKAWMEVSDFPAFSRPSPH